MTPLHRLAIVLGVAQVAVLAAAARRQHDPDGAIRDCGPRGRGPATRHRGPDHRGPGAGRPDGPSFRGRPDGPPPWMRERLEAWHRAQHGADDRSPATSDQDASEDA